MLHTGLIKKNAEVSLKSNLSGQVTPFLLLDVDSVRQWVKQGMNAPLCTKNQATL